VNLLDRKEQNENLEETVFKTLSNQKRRDILLFIGERKEATFTEIKNSVEIEDTPSLSYHLTALDCLIVQKSESTASRNLGKTHTTLSAK
jgi:predicted transcriptional regulator